MALRIITGERGFLIEVDGVQSEPHLFGFSAMVMGPGSQMYGAYVPVDWDTTSKPQLYRMVPVESIHLDQRLSADVDGYAEEFDEEEEDDDDDDLEEGEEPDDEIIE